MTIPRAEPKTRTTRLVNRGRDTHSRPRVGITAGDPAGIGPEIILKAAASTEVVNACLPVLIADAADFRAQAVALDLDHDWPVIEPFSVADLEAGPVVCDVGSFRRTLGWGVESAEAARAAVACIELGARLCQEGTLAAMATAPVNKRALQMAGSRFPGHTEMLASMCGSDHALMAFHVRNFWVVLLSTHLSLRSAIDAISKGRVYSTLVVTEREMRRFGLARPRIAVAGLNPHAGEGGLFGSEEQAHISPAIEEARSAGVDVSGPLPADTVFVRAAGGEFDVVVACYHDQGLIAVKCLGFGEAVNVTLGLPIIRTSVDHGTAFDIAGKGQADAGSMIEAILLAARLASARSLNPLTE